MLSSKKIKIGLIQFTGVLDPYANFSKIHSFINEANSQNLDWLFLPEAFVSLSNGKSPTPYLMGTHQLDRELQALAKEFSGYFIGGSAATFNPQGSPLNRTFSYDKFNNLMPYYDKRRLFNCNLPSDNKKINEADLYTAGSRGTLLEIDGIKIGLGICFDLRFPHFAWNYRSQGAQVLTYASAFTVPTGKAHWHTLLRARAIETQSFVIACAQWGKHYPEVETFGHSLVVSPWGEIIADAAEGEKLLTATLDFSLINSTRNKIGIDFASH